MVEPSRYVPPPEHGEHTLQVVGGRVTVHAAGQSTTAIALLDTGNEHMTVIDESFARRHGIYAPADGARQPRQRSVFAEAVREYTTLRGINPGAETRAPVITVSLTLRGRQFTIRTAISPLPGGHEVLVGLDVLRPLFAEGFVVAR